MKLLLGQKILVAKKSVPVEFRPLDLLDVPISPP